MSNRLYTLQARKSITLGSLSLPNGSIIKAQVKSKVDKNYKDEYIEYFELTIEAYASSDKTGGSSAQVLEKVAPFTVTTECEHLRFTNDYIWFWKK